MDIAVLLHYQFVIPILSNCFIHQWGRTSGYTSGDFLITTYFPISFTTIYSFIGSPYSSTSLWAGAPPCVQLARMLLPSCSWGIINNTSPAIQWCAMGY